MAAHARCAHIKRWAEATGIRSIQLWMAKEAVSAMDRLCRERGVKRAELLDSLISEAERSTNSGIAADQADGLGS